MPVEDSFPFPRRQQNFRRRAHDGPNTAAYGRATYFHSAMVIPLAKAPTSLALTNWQTAWVEFCGAMRALSTHLKLAHTNDLIRRYSSHHPLMQISSPSPHATSPS